MSYRLRVMPVGQIFICPPQNQTKLYYARHLPHIQSSFYPLFITWRLKFTIPNHIKLELTKLVNENNNKNTPIDGNSHQNIVSVRRFEYYDQYLSKVTELPYDLTDNSIAEIIRSVLLFHNGNRYVLYAFCIMSSHVHVIIQQLKQEDDNPYSLSKITQSWKRQSSTQIKKLLDLKSSIWQDESYDHVIRNEKELSYYIEYTLNNPVQAKLVKNWQDWEHSWINPLFLQ